LDLSTYHSVYFIGIGGIGMSALARWFNHAGFQVAGYDKTPSEITENLQNEGISITFNEGVETIPENFKNKNSVLVVYTPAIPKEHQGFNYFKEQGFQLIKRSVALGMLTKSKAGIAVAGTHGKTSVSTAIAWLLKEQCSAFLGGISNNLQSNVIINGTAPYVVVEADEYDRSFLTLYPQIAVITAMDADHLDIYGSKEAIWDSFYQFIKQIDAQGTLIYKLGLPITKEHNNEISQFTYSLKDSKADFYAKDIKVVDGYFHFTLVTPTTQIPDFVLGIPGLYNLENAVAALSAALIAKQKPELLKERLQQFKGVKRRFEFHVRSGNQIYIDDYAHHPQEIEACIQSIRYLYPGREITAVFQPHLYSRTRDFADAFAQSLDACDHVILLPVYPARELPIEGVSSEMLLELMQLKRKEVCSKENLVVRILELNTSIVVTMGAGNIDQLVKPLKEALLTKYKINK
jgi:UDP-N-acetylmuramate--alanine ligase